MKEYFVVGCFVDFILVMVFDVWEGSFVVSLETFFFGEGGCDVWWKFQVYGLYNLVPRVCSKFWILVTNFPNAQTFSIIRVSLRIFVYSFIGLNCLMWAISCYCWRCSM